MAFHAKFPGECARGDRIFAGDKCMYNEHNAIEHINCEEAAEERGDDDVVDVVDLGDARGQFNGVHVTELGNRKGMCGTCFMIHPGKAPDDCP